MSPSTIILSQFGIALVSLELAKSLSVQIYETATNYGSCSIDFTGVISITTQFANAMLSPVVKQFGKDEFRKKISFNFPNDDIMYTISDAIGL